MNKSYYNPTSFLDLLFNSLVGFFLLFMIAFLLINPSKRDDGIKQKAEFVIEVRWNDGFKSDVDTWLQDPAGNTVHFRQKDIGISHLDRDDLGIINDSLTLPDGTVITNLSNIERTTIRGFIKGEWTLNVHMYKLRDHLKPVEVEIRIYKLNPVSKDIFYKKISMSKQWEEITVTRFTMSKTGDILFWDDTPKKLIDSRIYGAF